MKLLLLIEAEYQGMDEEIETREPFDSQKYQVKITSTEDVILDLYSARIISWSEVTGD